MWFSIAVTKDCGGIAAIDRQMLRCVWQELGYRIDICRVTKGGHIEHL